MSAANSNSDNRLVSPGVNPFAIRKLRDEEVETASALAVQVFEQFVAPAYSLEGRAKFESYASVDALRKRHYENHVTLVADKKGRIVGMLHLKDACHISMLFVCREFQRSGVGRALIQAAVEHSQSGTDSVRVITVNSSPNAIHAYRRLGFRENGSERTVGGIRFIPMQMLIETGMPPP